MRIVAGAFRGRRLAPVGKGDAGAHLRPTTDRVRENLFNMLTGGTYGDPVSDADVLDVFAGTGALGLEALSRGARTVRLVENGRAGARLIQANIALTGTSGSARLIRRDATRPGPCDGPPATLVFLDPPYGKGLGDKALAGLVSGGWLAPQAIVVWEERGAQPPPPGFSGLGHRRYGDTDITILEAPGQARPDPGRS